jgi:hypothetical protein
MLKKILAGVSALALSLGMIALVAGPASAHTGSLSVSATCQNDGTYLVTFSGATTNVPSSGSGHTATLTVGEIQPVGAIPVGAPSTVVGNTTYGWTETVPGSTTYVQSTAFLVWGDGAQSDPQGTKNLDGTCGDNTDTKVNLCHHDNGNGGPDHNGYNLQNVSIESVIKTNGHDSHSDDVIPSFTYTKNGVQHTYPGKNLTGGGSAFLTNLCRLISVTATVPDHSDAVCTSAGHVGQGSYTIPSITGVTYQLKSGSHWNDLTSGQHNVSSTTTVIIQAIAQEFYTLTGDDGPWTITITVPTASKCVSAPDVTFANAYCNVDTTGTTAGSYTITAASHISYTVSINGGGATPIGAGTHGTQPGDVVVVTAVPDSGYLLVGTASPWSHTFSNPGDCLDGATAANVVFVDGYCNAATTGTTDGTYTIAVAAHITYTLTLNGVGPVAILPGQYSANPGDLVVITAIPDAGYTLVNTASPWSHTFGDPGDCLDKASAGDPTFTNSTCNVATTGASQGTYEVFAAANITYTVSINAGAPVPILPGTYNANPGDVIVITAIPDAGYKLDNTGSPWSHTFTDPGTCLDTVIPVAPGHTDETCTVDQDLHGHFVSGTIIIPDTVGVQYLIDGSVPNPADGTSVPGGTAYPATDGDHFVAAVALAGYTLDASYTMPFPVTIASALACGDLIDHPLVTPLVSSVQPTCSAAGSYTLSNDLFDAAALTWTVDGSTVSEATYQVTGDATVHIHAAANGPAFGLNGTPQVDWTLDFSLPANCDLKTLALTGSTPEGGMLLAYFMVLAGIGIITVRAVRRHGRPQE